MNGNWFCVKCKVDNGCTIENWNSLVFAENEAQAQLMAKSDWEVRDNETVAEVLSVRMVHETEIFTMRTR